MDLAGLLLSVVKDLLLIFYGCLLMECFSEKEDGRWKRYATIWCFPAFSLAVMQLIIVIKDIHFSVSLAFVKDYLCALLLGENRKYLYIFYVLLLFGLFAPFFRIMLNALSQQEQKILLFVILGYFAFFTSEVVLGYQIAIANFPFINHWGYVICGFLICRIEWTKREKIFLTIAGITSLVSMVCVHFFYPSLESSMDYLFLYQVGTALLLYVFVFGKRRTEKAWQLFPVCLILPFLVEVCS